MNRVRGVLILLILGISLWFVWNKPRTNTVIKNTENEFADERPSAPASQAMKTKSVVVTSPAPRVSLPVQMPAASADPHKPPDNSMPFEVIKGFVVAYGDILLGKPTRDDFPPTGFIKAQKPQLWARGEIPFSLHESLPNPERVLRAIAYFNENTSVKFVPYSGQADNIVFMPFDGICLSYLGKIGGNQPIYLDDRCGDQEVMHEILHALGFIHEHSRPDRDAYVQVNWDNIEEDKQSQFMVMPDSISESASGRPFDFNSIMMYSPDIFALDRSRPTIQSRRDTAIAPVQEGLSAEDLNRLRKMYPR
ncbi:MAG: M12 family metallopeptidase [Bdellovibrionales bacterium]|nr:M12 family metallopeptidase [Bdellovibrionales bacterium]